MLLVKIKLLKCIGRIRDIHFMGFNPSPLEQNCHHFTDNIFKCIFMNENVCILIEISLKCVPIGSDNGLPPNRQQAIIWTNDG